MDHRGDASRTDDLQQGRRRADELLRLLVARLVSPPAARRLPAAVPRFGASLQVLRKPRKALPAPGQRTGEGAASLLPYIAHSLQCRPEPPADW